MHQDRGFFAQCFRINSHRERPDWLKRQQGQLSDQLSRFCSAFMSSILCKGNLLHMIRAVFVLLSDVINVQVSGANVLIRSNWSFQLTCKHQVQVTACSQCLALSLNVSLFLDELHSSLQRSCKLPMKCWRMSYSPLLQLFCFSVPWTHSLQALNLTKLKYTVFMEIGSAANVLC